MAVFFQVNLGQTVLLGTSSTCFRREPWELMEDGFSGPIFIQHLETQGAEAPVASG